MSYLGLPEDFTHTAAFVPLSASSISSCSTESRPDDALLAVSPQAFIGSPPLCPIGQQLLARLS